MSGKKHLRLKLPFRYIPPLIIVDMLIKAIVTGFFMGKRKLFFGGLFGFFPHINKEQMGINHELAKIGMHISNGANIILNILLIIVVGGLLIRLNRKKIYGREFAIGSCIGMAACICSLLDKIIWGGSPDYMYIINAFIIDLKDIYMFAGVIMCFSIYLRTELKNTKTSRLCYYNDRNDSIKSSGRNG